MRIYVIDCSTWIRALGGPGIYSQALELIGTDHVIAISRAIYEEIVEVLSRPRLAKRMRADTIARLGGILADALWVEATERIAECVDPDDDIYLECALEAKADFIVSNDDHLLRMDPWRNIRILRPEDLLRLPDKDV